MNIYQRINEVRRKVDKIRKDKKVEGYMAVTHDSVTALVREHLIEHGIVIVPAGIKQSNTKDTGTFTSRGTPFVRTEIVYCFEIVNAEEPQDRFRAEIEAHALDHGDKAPGKALSYAKKALMLKLLEIESYEGEEEREVQFKPKGSSITASAAAKDAFESLPKDRQNIVMDTVTQVVDALNEDRNFDAYGLCESVSDPEEKLALWSRLDSKQRSAIKKQSQVEKEKRVS